MINNFTTKENRWLSNFFKCSIKYKDLTFTSAEQMYVYFKVKNKEDKQLILNTATAVEAKKIGRQAPMMDNWDNIKLRCMEYIITQKFIQNTSLKEKLIATDNKILIEGNYWHDNFWGICSCDKCKDLIGQNNLGFILMKVRSKLKESLT
jgi:hypothetical protein